MKNEVWCITTDGLIDETMYLGWQNPAWTDDGYFWTYKDVISEILANNTPEHPFLFKSRKDAIAHLKSINLPQRCRVIRFL